MKSLRRFWGYLANQIGVSGDNLSQYEFIGRTGKRDRTEILSFLGIRRANKNDKSEFAKALLTDMLPSAIQPSMRCRTMPSIGLGIAT